MNSITQVIDLIALDRRRGRVTFQDCRDLLVLPANAWAYLVREVDTGVVSVEALYTPTPYYYSEVLDLAVCPTLDQVAEVLLTWQV